MFSALTDIVVTGEVYSQNMEASDKTDDKIVKLVVYILYTVKYKDPGVLFGAYCGRSSPYDFSRLVLFTMGEVEWVYIQRTYLA